MSATSFWSCVRRVAPKVGRSIACVFFVSCIYFAFIHSREEADRWTLWEYSRECARDDIRWFKFTDPYWTIFDDDCPNLSDDSLLVSLPHDAAVYTAQWHEDDGVYGIDYYRDRRGKCVVVYYNSSKQYVQVSPYDYWHIINARGLVCLDWVRLLADLGFVVLVFLLPIWGFWHTCWDRWPWQTDEQD